MVANQSSVTAFYMYNYKLILIQVYRPELVYVYEFKALL